MSLDRGICEQQIAGSWKRVAGGGGCQGMVALLSLFSAGGGGVQAVSLYLSSLLL